LPRPRPPGRTPAHPHGGGALPEAGTPRSRGGAACGGYMACCGSLLRKHSCTRRLFAASVVKAQGIEPELRDDLIKQVQLCDAIPRYMCEVGAALEALARAHDVLDKAGIGDLDDAGPKILVKALLDGCQQAHQIFMSAGTAIRTSLETHGTALDACVDDLSHADQVYAELIRYREKYELLERKRCERLDRGLACSKKDHERLDRNLKKLQQAENAASVAQTRARDSLHSCISRRGILYRLTRDIAAGTSQAFATMTATAKAAGDSSFDQGEVKRPSLGEACNPFTPVLLTPAPGDVPPPPPTLSGPPVETRLVSTAAPSVQSAPRKEPAALGVGAAAPAGPAALGAGLGALTGTLLDQTTFDNKGEDASAALGAEPQREANFSPVKGGASGDETEQNPFSEADSSGSGSSRLSREYTRGPVLCMETTGQVCQILGSAMCSVLGKCASGCLSGLYATLCPPASSSPKKDSARSKESDDDFVDDQDDLAEPSGSAPAAPLVNDYKITVSRDNSLGDHFGTAQVQAASASPFDPGPADQVLASGHAPTA